MVLAFAGWRPESVPFGEDETRAECIRLKAMLLTEIMDRAAKGYDVFYCRAERGGDILFGELVLWVKATTYPQIRLLCALPCEEQASGWPEKWRDRYFALLERADDNVLIAHARTPGCRRRRDRYMVDNADALLAVGDGSEHIVRCARRREKEIVRIDPRTLLRTVEAQK